MQFIDNKLVEKNKAQKKFIKDIRNVGVANKNYN